MTPLPPWRRGDGCSSMLLDWRLWLSVSLWMSPWWGSIAIYFILSALEAAR